MTHGGIHGVYEGICNAVPMLMFPLFGDQGENVHRMVARGVAEKLSIYDEILGISKLFLQSQEIQLRQS